MNNLAVEWKGRIFIDVEARHGILRSDDLD
jgi:hypothetical protein